MILSQQHQNLSTVGIKEIVWLGRQSQEIYHTEVWTNVEISFGSCCHGQESRARKSDTRPYHGGIREQFLDLHHACSRQQVPSHFAFNKDQMSVTFGFFRPLPVHSTQQAAPPLGQLLSSFEGSSCTVETFSHQTGHLNQSSVANM